MPHERYFTNHDLEEGMTLSLDENEAHHLIAVMRGRIGSSVELINGRGVLAQAEVVHIQKKAVELKVIKIIAQTPPSLSVIVAQAIPRPNRLDYIIEKGTELGMTELWLFPGELSEKKELSDSQLERALKLTISAMKQCGRLDLPQIKIFPKIAKWNFDQSSQMGFFGDVSVDAPPLLSLLKKNTPSLFVVGPESGLTENEENELKKKGFLGVKLHHNILRTDTAPIVALSVIQHFNL